MAHVLHHGRERRGREAGGGNIVEADNRDIAGNGEPRFPQRAHRADGNEVARGKDRIERLAAGELVAESHWLVADRQVQGRGRQGREWFDGLDEGVTGVDVDAGISICNWGSQSG